MAQQEVESSAPESSDPSLSRNLSFSKLNAKAREFVPTRPQQPPTRLTVVPTPPPPPPPVLHIYPPPPHPAPFHVQIHSPVPLPHVIPLQNHHNHNNSHQAPPPQQQYVPVRNHNSHGNNNNHYGGQQRRYHGNNHHNHHHHSQYRKTTPHEEQQGEAAVGSKDAAVTPSDHSPDRDSNGLGISDEAARKLLSQVEYYFSDINLATTDHLMRFISKDPDGYVPLSVVSSFNKIKAAITSISQLAAVLRNSSKLVVSEDGKKVRRQQPLTESDMEELQSRVVVAENLPEDHCHQHLMKIFSSVGNVRTIRTCPPQVSGNGSASAARSGKADGGMHFSSKLHSFVEYESVEMAEKAVVELNDERNWRSGLRVRLMRKRVPKPTPASARGKKGNDGPGQSEEEDVLSADHVPDEKQIIEDAPPEQCDGGSNDQPGEDHDHVNEKEGGQRKPRNKGRGKGQGQGRGRGQYQHNRNRGGNQVGTPPSNNVIFGEHPIVSKQPPGPRMPDGTKGFAMGRGKPVTVNNG